MDIGQRHLRRIQAVCLRQSYIGFGRLLRAGMGITGVFGPAGDARASGRAPPRYLPESTPKPSGE